MTNPICIDLSHWNPEPDWQSLKANGTLGVILKATEGTSYVDPTFSSRRVAAQQAGLAVSTYHFLKHGNVGKQMDWWLKAVKPVPGERMCIDHEDPACTLADLQDAVRYLMSQPWGLQVTVYSGHLIKDQLGTTKDILLADTSLWLAQYSQTPSWPSGTWPTWTLWQYTDKANAKGVSAPVDGNQFNGSAENFLKWINPAGADPVPLPPEPDDDLIVAIAIATPPGVDVEVTVNDVLLVRG